MWFLSGSAKRKEIFLEIAAVSDAENEELLEGLTTADDDELADSVTTIKSGAKRKSVPKCCATRWSARVCTLSAMLAKYPRYWKLWTGDSSGEAVMHPRIFDYWKIYSLSLHWQSVAQAILSFLDPVTKALQAKDCDLAIAYKDVMLAKECIQDATKLLHQLVSH